MQTFIYFFFYMQTFKKVSHINLFKVWISYRIGCVSLFCPKAVAKLHTGENMVET